MSISHVILDSQLNLKDVINTFKSIGIETDFIDEDDGNTFYVIGNDTYGYTRMYVEDGAVTGFHQFDFGERPIGMLFSCFKFMAYDTSDYDDEFCDDLLNLTSREFFAKHYSFESKIYGDNEQREKEFEEDHPDLHAYVMSKGRTLDSYRFECAFANSISVKEVTKVDEVVQFMYDQLIVEDQEAM